jgi:hypothetical protein
LHFKIQNLFYFEICFIKFRDILAEIFNEIFEIPNYNKNLKKTTSKLSVYLSDKEGLKSKKLIIINCVILNEINLKLHKNYLIIRKF